MLWIRALGGVKRVGRAGGETCRRKDREDVEKVMSSREAPSGRRGVCLQVLWSEGAKEPAASRSCSGVLRSPAVSATTPRGEPATADEGG